MILTKMLSLFLSFCLIFEQAVFAQAIDLSHYFANSGKAVIQSDKFRPLHLRYISYDGETNDFQVLLDKGDFFNQQTPKLLNSSTPKLEEATQELMKYFFIGLSLPNEKFWVNLRPDSPDNILDPDLEKTDIGRIFLEADLQLKKDTSGMTSPQTPEGKTYWDKLYKKAGELFPAAGGSAFGGGTENITIPTITRPWIVPAETIIGESPEGAYIYKATLKVMLEEDYLRGINDEGRGTRINYGFNDPRLKELNEYSTHLIKETIIPKLTYEVNTSKRYAPLRQVYYSLILAQWFKQKYGSLGSVRASGILPVRQAGRAPVNSYIDLIDSGNLANLASKEPYNKQTYFKQYQKSFADGEYNLQEPIYTPTGQSIRRYVSGGEDFTRISKNVVSSSMFKKTPFTTSHYLIPISYSDNTIQKQKTEFLKILAANGIKDNTSVEEAVEILLDKIYEVKAGDALHKITFLNIADPLYITGKISERISRDFFNHRPTTLLSRIISETDEITIKLNMLKQIIRKLSNSDMGEEIISLLGENNMLSAFIGSPAAFWYIFRDAHSVELLIKAINAKGSKLDGLFNDIMSTLREKNSLKYLLALLIRSHPKYYNNFLEFLNREKVKITIDEIKYGLLENKHIVPGEYLVINSFDSLAEINKLVGPDKKEIRGQIIYSYGDEVAIKYYPKDYNEIPPIVKAMIIRHDTDGKTQLCYYYNDKNSKIEIISTGEEVEKKLRDIGIIGGDGYIVIIKGSGEFINRDPFPDLSADMHSHLPGPEFSVLPSRHDKEFANYFFPKFVHPAATSPIDSAGLISELFKEYQKKEYLIEHKRRLNEINLLPSPEDKSHKPKKNSLSFLPDDGIIEIDNYVFKRTSLESINIPFKFKICNKLNAESFVYIYKKDLNTLYVRNRHKEESIFVGMLPALSGLIYLEFFIGEELIMLRHEIKDTAMGEESIEVNLTKIIPAVKEAGRLLEKFMSDKNLREFLMRIIESSWNKLITESNVFKIISEFLRIQPNSQEEDILRKIAVIDADEYTERGSLSGHIREYCSSLRMSNNGKERIVQIKKLIKLFRENIETSKALNTETIIVMDKVFSRIEKVIAAYSSSPVADSDKGGIDFSRPEIITQPMSGLQSLAGGALTINPNLDFEEEWRGIQMIFNAGIRPSARRMTEFAASASASPLNSRRLEDLRGLVTDLLRRDEEDEKPAPADPGLKELLAILALRKV